MTTSPDGGDAVARSLAQAFLAGAWEATELTGRGAAVLGGRRRWLRPLVAQVLQSYPQQPADRPRELAAFIRGSTPFVAAARTLNRTGRRLHAVQQLPAQVRMVRPTGPARRLDDVGAVADLLRLDVAALDWFADVRRFQRRTPLGPLQHYRYRWIPRTGSVPRLLEAPRPRLRELQRVLLREVVGLLPIHPAAHGFVPGRSAVTHARRHAGHAVVASLDLTTFFAAIDARRVYGVLRRAGYPEPVAHVLAGLTTTATPAAVLAAMPPGGDPDQRFRLRTRLSTAHLPQGAPSSPHLANLVAARLDRRLSGYAEAAGMTYGRYADDLTFSGDRSSPAAARVLAAAARIVVEEGFAVNPAKTRVRTRSDRQLVTGLVVNEHPAVRRSEYDRLRAVLHDAVVNGPDAANRTGHPDFRAHLQGRVAWVTSVDAGRGRRLQRRLAEIDWGPQLSASPPAASQPPEGSEPVPSK